VKRRAETVRGRSTAWSSASLAFALVLLAGAARAQETTEPPPSDAPERARPRPLNLSPSFDAGYVYQLAYLPMQGFALSAVLGSQGRDLRLGAAVDAAFSWTSHGLPVTTTGLGPIVEGCVGRMRLAGGVRVGTFNVGRVTQSGNIFTFSTGAYARSSFDLVTFGDGDTGAFYLMVRGSVDAVGAPLLGLTAGLGVRL
jgi:hypothetical protein